MFVYLNDQKSPPQYQLLDEETILDAKQAVLSVLTEECADHNDNDGVVLQVQECIQHIAGRLQTTIPHHTAIARQVLEHLRVANTETNSDVLHLDSHKVRTYKHQRVVNWKMNGMDGLGTVSRILFYSYIVCTYTHPHNFFL
jgi:hypothetical protein